MGLMGARRVPVLVGVLAAGLFPVGVLAASAAPASTSRAIATDLSEVGGSAATGQSAAGESKYLDG